MEKYFKDYDPRREEDRQKLLRDKRTILGAYFGKKKNFKETDEEILTLFVKKKLPEIEIPQKEFIPHHIQGVKTDVVELGEISACSVIDSGAMRPVLPGCSIRNFKSQMAGSLGCLLRTEPFDGDLYFLSASHVLLEDPFSESKRQERIIVQPGDSFRKEDRIGIVIRSTVLRENDINSLDAGILKLDRTDLGHPSFFFGLPKGISELKEGELGLLDSWAYAGEGNLLFSDVLLKIVYPESRTVLFRNCDIFQKLSIRGSSGAVIVTPEGHCSHLLFAGSEKYSVATKVSRVLSTFQRYKLVDADWWEDFLGNERKGKKENQTDTSDLEQEVSSDKPPALPSEWSLATAGSFIFLLGSFLIGEAQRKGNQTLMILGLLLSALGLSAVSVSVQKQIKKKEK